MGEAVTLTIAVYSKAKTKEDFLQIIKESPIDPQIDFTYAARPSGPLGTLKEYRKEFGLSHCIVVGEDYTLEVKYTNNEWQVLGGLNSMSHEGKPIEIQEKEKEGLTDYGKMLYDEGLPSTRIPDLIKGIDKIHGAICRLNYPNLLIFMKKSIEERLEEWAPTCGSKSITLMREAAQSEEV